MSDAIVALEIATGRVVWSKQTTPGDAYNSSCGTDKQNCPDEDGPDYDFGSSAILTQLPGGRDILLAGQKSGMVYALDPEKKGELLWQVRIATRGPNVGPSVGVQWGMSTDGQRVYAATSAWARTPPKDPLDTRRNILDPQARRRPDGAARRRWQQGLVRAADCLRAGRSVRLQSRAIRRRHRRFRAWCFRLRWTVICVATTPRMAK